MGSPRKSASSDQVVAVVAGSAEASPTRHRTLTRFIRIRLSENSLARPHDCGGLSILAPNGSTFKSEILGTRGSPVWNALPRWGRELYAPPQPLQRHREEFVTLHKVLL